MAPSLDPISSMEHGENTRPDPTTESHLASLKDLLPRLNKSAQTILQKSRTYDRVAALVTYWSEDCEDPQYRADENLKYMKRDAQKLYEVFKDQYGFDVGEKPFELPGDLVGDDYSPRDSLQDEIKKVVVGRGISSSKENNLFILYYGGHGSEGGLWQPKVKGNKSIPWDSLQDDLVEKNCDILFIFDCCYGGEMVKSSNQWRRRCELLCATAAEETTPGGNENSFTQAVVKVLEDELRTHNGCDLVTLHSLLNNRTVSDRLDFKLERRSWYQMFTKPSQPAITLYKMKAAATVADPMTPVRVRDISAARVLLKIAFSNPHDSPVLKEWENFVRCRPSNISQMEFFAFKDPSEAQKVLTQIICDEFELISHAQSNSITTIIREMSGVGEAAHEVVERYEDS